jgi:predicted nucleic acid-binding protein
MTMLSNRVFVDTNVLIYRTFSLFDVEKHEAVKQCFEAFSRDGIRLCISQQVLREFFSISTNAKFFDEPLTTAEACQMMQEFSMVFEVLVDAPIMKLTELLLKYNVSRQKIHDTNLVATMLYSGVKELYTFNIKDFKHIDEISLVTHT